MVRAPQLICDYYTVPKTASSEVMEYSRFLDDIDVIFTKKVLGLTVVGQCCACIPYEHCSQRAR